MSARAVTYEDKPWLAQLTPAQRAPVTPPETLLHTFRAAVREVPRRAALVYFDGRLDYAELDALSDSVAAHLAARGLRRGDRVALMLQNTPHYVLALLGAWKAGGVVVPVNPMYKEREVSHVLADAEVSALVCSDRAWERMLRASTAGSGVHTVLTACERDLQTRDDPPRPGLRAVRTRRRRHRSARRRTRRRQGPRRAYAGGRRHRAHQLHLGHQRHP